MVVVVGGGVGGVATQDERRDKSKAPYSNGAWAPASMSESRGVCVSFITFFFLSLSHSLSIAPRLILSSDDR